MNQLFFAGKADQAAHDVQPQGGGTAAEDTGFFLHGRISLLFQQQYAPKEEKYSNKVESLEFRVKCEL